VRRVAYDGLSKKERKSRHLAAASYLESAWGSDEGELVEVVASHYLSAFELVPNADDAATLKARAAEMQTKAGVRAASLAASEEAQRYFEQAADLSDEPEARAGLLELAGQMAWMGGRGPSARTFYERSIELFQSLRNTHSAARVSARLGEVTWAEGHIEQAVADMERSYEILAAERPDEDLATLAAQLGRFLFFAGREGVGDRLEHALTIAESMGFPEVLSQALTTKGIMLVQAKGRAEEGIALMKRALEIALENDVPSSALRAYYNLACCQGYRAMFDASFRAAEDGLALARRLGDRFWEWNFVALLIYVRFLVGDWHVVLDLGEVVSHLEDFSTFRFAAVELLVLVHLHVARGQLDEANRVLDTFAPFGSSSDVQERASYLSASAAMLRVEGRLDEALTAALEACEFRTLLGPSFSGVCLGFFEAGQAALALGDTATIRKLVSVIDNLGAGETSPLLKGIAERFKAHVAKEQNDASTGKLFETAENTFRKAGAVFWLGVTLLEHAEWVASDESPEGDVAHLTSEARAIFEQLGATSWLGRVERLALTPSAAVQAHRP